MTELRGKFLPYLMCRRHFWSLGFRLKTLNEEKQRNTRKLRAEGKLPPHEPRWFNATVDDDTRERLWEPKRAENGEVAFWSVREKKNWDAAGIEHIFASDEA